VEKLQDAETNQGVVELMQALHCGGMRVAVKRMPTTWVRHGPAEFNLQHPGSKEQPWNDLGITKYLNGIGFPFACDLRGVFRDCLTTYVVSSFATEGDLFSWVDRSGCAGHEHEARAKPIVVQVFFAVWWLHELGIAHRDLSLENILLTKQGDNHLVKIIDFGAATASRHCGEDESRGKRNYQAPEMHAGGYDAFAADSFALGVVLFATMAHDFPWTSTAPDACKLYGYAQRNGLRALLKARRARKQPSRRLIEVLSPTLVDAIEGLSQADPDARLNLGEACRTDHGQSSFWATPWAQEL
jgi:serine/threonine protein kinase